MMYTPDIRNILVLSQQLGMLDGQFAFFGLDAGLDSRMLYGLKPEVCHNIFVCNYIQQSQASACQ